VVSWTPTCGQAGSYGAFTLNAHAATGESGSGSFSLTVTHKVGTVAVAAIGTQTVAETALLTVTPSATLTSCAAAPVSWTAVGLPTGAAIDAGTGVVTWTPDCAAFEHGPDYGPVTVTAHAATGESGSTSFSIHVADTPVAIGNGSSGMTGITVNFTTPSGATAIEVYRASFGNYPEYASTAPTVPGYPPDARWTLTGVTASGQVDHPPTRDFWYYVAFAKNACGDVSLASDMTGGTLNYHLGDVTNGATPGVGDNLVDGLDVSLLGAHYGISGGAVLAYAYLDVGPTTTGLPDGRPLPDDVIDFEDLVIFAINYGEVAVPQARVRPAAAASSGSDELTLERPGLVTPGALVDVQLRLRGSGALAALSTRLSWDPAIVEPVGHAAGDWLEGLGGIALSPRAGTVDAAALRSGGMSGEGLLATVTFRVLAAGDPQIRIAAADGRDARNQKLVVSRLEQPLASSVPSETRLQPAAPNPFQTTATLAYSLARAGQVELAVYSVDGRRIRTVVNEFREPGEYRPVWDGRDDRGNRASAGVYYVRLEAAGRRFTHTLVYLR
jgi:hypothetical protein